MISRPSGSTMPWAWATAWTSSGLASSTQRAMPRAWQIAAACTVRGSRPSGDDALAGLLRALHHLVAERRRRQAQLARRTAALLEPFEIDVPGDELGDPLGALAVVHRDFLVHPVQVGRGVVGAGGHRQHRQAALQGAAAEFHDPRVGREVAAQQQPGQGYAVHRGQAGGEDDVVAVAGVTTSTPGLSSCTVLGTARAHSTIFCTRRCS